jgi:uncharacterized protein YcfL
MKKIFLILFVSVLLVGCSKDSLIPRSSANLTMTTPVGIKLATPFVTSDVAMNVKSEESGVVSIKMFDISNRVISKEEIHINVGDNILTLYTTILPSSAYRIGVYNSIGGELGITDFNKLQIK